MILNLYWSDHRNNSYFLGSLTRQGDKYHFELSQKDYAQAVDNGCCGLGELSVSKDSDSLFGFFKVRIPPENHPHLASDLIELGMTKYDEMEFLKRTHGRLLTDKFYLD